jgi:hypothetical protein
MAMVFCRGCGKEIHETAILCPHCGCQYSDSGVILGGKNLWMAVTSAIIAFLSFLNWFEVAKWDSDLKVGIWTFSIISIVLSTVSLSQNHRGKVLNYVSIAVSVISICLLIDKM